VARRPDRDGPTQRPASLSPHARPGIRRPLRGRPALPASHTSIPDRRVSPRDRRSGV